MFPTVQAGFGASQNQTSDVLAPIPANGNTIYGLFTAGVTISYTLDLFGANRRAIESLDALAEAQCFQLEAAYLSLASNVVAAAIQEASLRAQIEATKRIIAAQRETLGILRQQEGLGAITGADVATQEPRSPRPRPRCHRSKRCWRKNATCWPRSPAACRAIGWSSASNSPTSSCRRNCRSACHPGWSSSGRRARSEAALHSASAQVGVAIANQFPQITLSAGVNTTSLAFGQLLGPGLTGSNVGASVLQTSSTAARCGPRRRRPKRRSSKPMRSIVRRAHRLPQRR